MEKELFKEPVNMPKAKRLLLTVLDVILFFVLMSVIYAFATIPFESVFAGVPHEELTKDIPALMLKETIMVIAVLASAFIVLSIRKIPLSRIGLSVRWKDLLYGMLFAMGIYLLGFGLSLLLGAVQVTDVRFQPHFLLLTFMFFLLVAVAEEVAMRGFILGRLLDGGVNKYQALLISAILFSLMHLLNPNFAFVPFLNIALAGLLLGASYIFTRNLSFPIALHLFWNWLQGPILGYEVSGNKFGESLLTLRLSELNLINGGAFGFEGSVLCTALIAAGTLLVIRYYRRRPIPVLLLSWSAVFFCVQCLC